MTHAETESPPISTSIVETVADAEDVDPAELTTYLYDAIDIDALNDLFSTPSRTNQTDIYMTFTYHGYEITASHDYVSIEEHDK